MYVTDHLASLKANINRVAVLITEKPIIELKSGKLSNFYIDIRVALDDAACLQDIGHAMLYTMEGMDFGPIDFIGAVMSGGAPLKTCMLKDASPIRQHPLRGISVLQQPKGHGITSCIQGLMYGETLAGKNVLLVEDVITTGGSVLKAVNAVRQAGGIPLGVLVVVDRRTRDAVDFEALGLKFASLFKASDFYPAGFTPLMIDPPTD